MLWIKIGIIVIGSLYALLIPYVVHKALQNYIIDLKLHTLSFLSNKVLYGKKSVRGYKLLLLVTAMLHYVFFWLLARYYYLGENERYLLYVDYTFAAFTLLALVPHNMMPYSFKTLKSTVRRLLHNIMALVIFILLPTLIITFQTAVIASERVLGTAGFIIIGLVILSTSYSIYKYGISGNTELVFIYGISSWSVFVTLITLIF